MLDFNLKDRLKKSFKNHYFKLQPFNKHLLSIYYVPSSELWARDTKMVMHGCCLQRVLPGDGETDNDTNTEQSVIRC